MISLFSGITRGVVETVPRPGPISQTLTQAAQVFGAFQSSPGAASVPSGESTPVWLLWPLQTFGFTLRRFILFARSRELVLLLLNVEFSGSKMPSDPDMEPCPWACFLLSGHDQSCHPLLPGWRELEQ